MAGRMSQNKGKRFERRIAKLFATVYPAARRTPNSGALDSLKGDILWTGDFHVECKCQEHFNVWAALRQSREDNTDSTKTSIVVFSKNNEKDYVAIEAGDFINLLLELKELKEGE